MSLKEDVYLLEVEPLVIRLGNICNKHGISLLLTVETEPCRLHTAATFAAEHPANGAFEACMSLLLHDSTISKTEIRSSGDLPS